MNPGSQNTVTTTQRNAMKIDNLIDPTSTDLDDPLFEAVWQSIKGWDLSRNGGIGASYAGASGTDVMSIINPVRQTIAEWAVEQWRLQVENRPPENIHRRSLDNVWRQVIRRMGADDVSLIGPAHETAQGNQMNTHDKIELPQLPDQVALTNPKTTGITAYGYTSEQMESYARAAIEHFLNQSGQYITNAATRQAAIDEAIEADRKRRGDNKTGRNDATQDALNKVAEVFCMDPGELDDPYTVVSAAKDFFANWELDRKNWDRQRGGEPICNLWVNPETLEYEVDRCTHPLDELIPVHKAPVVNESLTAAEPAKVPSAKFTLGDHVRKTKGSRWQGIVVGTYSTSLTPEGYAVESDAETGSVQIYPAAALEPVEPEPAADAYRAGFNAALEQVKARIGAMQNKEVK